MLRIINETAHTRIRTCARARTKSEKKKKKKIRVNRVPLTIRLCRRSGLLITLRLMKTAGEGEEGRKRANADISADDCRRFGAAARARARVKHQINPVSSSLADDENRRGNCRLSGSVGFNGGLFVLFPSFGNNNIGGRSLARTYTCVCVCMLQARSGATGNRYLPYRARVRNIVGDNALRQPVRRTHVYVHACARARAYQLLNKISTIARISTKPFPGGRYRASVIRKGRGETCRLRLKFNSARYDSLGDSPRINSHSFPLATLRVASLVRVRAHVRVPLDSRETRNQLRN